MYFLKDVLKGDRLNLDECHGWDCPEIVEQFAAYAAYCFEQFGDRVKHWITLNEPEVFIDEGYWWCEDRVCPVGLFFKFQNFTALSQITH